MNQNQNVKVKRNYQHFKMFHSTLLLLVLY